MFKILVNHTFHNTTVRYGEIKKILEDESIKCRHLTTSCYLVETKHNVQNLRSKFADIVNGKDRMYFTDISDATILRLPKIKK